MTRPEATTPRHRRRRPRRAPEPPGPRPPLGPLPELAYPPELPINEKRAELVAAIRAHPVVIVTGATGSGKTTQLPKMCLEAGRGLVACTQPRRIAAVTVAARVAEELGPAGAELVGYKIRFADRTRPTTRIKFVTDGMLLAETQGDPELAAYDTVIVDEAHERSLNIDFLLGILKRLLTRRDDLRVVITSATIDTEKFAAAFGGAPVIEVSGRTYPVEVRYQPLRPEDEEAGDVTYVDQAVEAVAALHRAGHREDVLVFLPTERDIVEAAEALEGRRLDRAVVVPLYGRLSAGEQGRAFQPVRGQKIVVATNVAETSVTVPGIRYVVDAGLARLSTYNPRTRTHGLPIRPISRASADQRSGRCGRVGPGICIRLYAEEDYQGRPEFTAPEIQRSNLAEVLLRMIALNLGEPAAFPFVDPPSDRAVKDGFAALLELGAIDGARRLTPAGRVMARLPLDPAVSRMLLEARKNRCLREVAVIASALSVQDPRERPAEKRAEADQAHARFRVPGSDFLEYLKIWDAFHDTLEELKSQGKVRKFCKAHFLSYNRMREWRDVHEQITGVLRGEPGFEPNGQPAEFAAIHKAILAGHLRSVGLKKEKGVYLGAQGKALTVFPGSTQARKAGDWIVAGELVETSRLFARTVATVEAGWIEEVAAPLLKRSYAEPHWEKARGQVVATERATLFGLPVVAGRRVDYGRIDPAGARELFLRALVEGEVKGRFGFLEHNRELLARAEELESRLRRRGLVPDDQALYAFYDERVGEVWDERTFARLLKDRGSDEFLRLREEDLLPAAPDEVAREPFPATLRVGDVELALAYRFEPGQEDDGVTALVPAQLAPELAPEVFEWLVPGLLGEKVELLLKGLPKTLRRHLVPVPRTAAALTADLGPPQGSLLARLQELLRRDFRLRVERADWAEAALPAHLRMRFRVVDPAGEVLWVGRSWGELLAGSGPPALAGAAVDLLAQARRKWERDDLTDLHFPELPERIPLGAGGFAFPALARQDSGRAALRLFADPAEARAAAPGGLRALYATQFGSELSVLKKDLALPRDRWPLVEGLGGAAAAAQDLFDFVLGAVFEVGDGRLPDADVFQARVAGLKNGGLFRRAREVVDRVFEVLRERRETLDLLAKHQRQAQGAGRAAHLRRELERLVPADFLRTADAGRLTHLPRYLKALRVRAERARLAPPKDAERAAQVAPHEERLAAARAAGPLTADQAALVEEYAWWVEELRVSVFAQELGTAVPVSPQRLDRKWEEVREMLPIRPAGRGR
ncbi:MAG: ATP-dependent RNA helicase HrpA [Deferrisomatales bacterium]